MEGTDASGSGQSGQTSGLRKEITLFGLTMIAAGACIGSGIFITPAEVALLLGNPGAVLLAWAVGGVVALTGSLTFAELAGRLPQAGGVYVFIRESFGRLWAFLYGWVILTVVTSGAIAALSLTFARYLGTIIPLSSTGQVVVGITAITAVTLVNILGVKPGEVFSSVFTVLKLLGILAIIVAGIMLGTTFSLDATHDLVTKARLPVESFALAMIGVLWSYGGWHHASYVASEARAAPRIVPKAMILGALIVTVTYVLMNWAYLRLMPLDAIAGSQAVAADAMGAVFPGGGVIVAGLIAVSTFGSIGIFTLTAPRIYYTMAKDGAFFRMIAKLHPKHQTPVFAILLQSAWAVVLLLLWETFENLITYVVFMDWVFMTLAALAIFYFRKKMDKPGTGLFRTPLYPLVPLIFIAISAWFIVYTLIGKPAQALGGILLLVIGLPVYYYSRRKS